MRCIIVFCAIIVLCKCQESDKNASSSSEEISQNDPEETVEDVIRQFEERATKTKDSITNNTQDVIDLAKESVEKSMLKAEHDAKSLLTDGERIVTEFTKIKSKIEKDLKNCEDKFLGESSILGHILGHAKELETLVEEIMKCPTSDIQGMGCTLGKLIRGEAIMEEVEKLMANEEGTSEKRADAILKWIESCNIKAIENGRLTIEKFMSDLKDCKTKDEL